MSNDPETLIFQSDPNRFLDLVMTDDTEARFNRFALFDDIALCEIVRYGIYNDEGMISDLSRFYREMIMKKEEEERFELYQHIAGLVENASGPGSTALGAALQGPCATARGSLLERRETRLTHRLPVTLFMLFEQPVADQ